MTSSSMPRMALDLRPSICLPFVLPIESTMTAAFTCILASAAAAEAVYALGFALGMLGDRDQARRQHETALLIDSTHLKAGPPARAAPV
jgi:hypothetical protein